MSTALLSILEVIPTEPLTQIRRGGPVGAWRLADHRQTVNLRCGFPYHGLRSEFDGELVTNALKYAYADKAFGEVFVELKASTDQILLRVTDKGRGLPEGFDLKKHSSEGMKILKSLTRQLRGEISMLNQHPGLQCSLGFPR